MLAYAFPQGQPAVHAEGRLELLQGTVDHGLRGVAEHLGDRLVGVAHAAVPVDPEDAHRTVVEGELRQAQGLLGHLALGQGLPRFQQALLQPPALAPQHAEQEDADRQQQAEQDAQAAPEQGGFAEARLLRRQPALLQLLQLLGRQLAQAGVENGAQLRPVGPGTEAQQLRQADVGNDRQA